MNNIKTSSILVCLFLLSAVTLKGQAARSEVQAPPITSAVLINVIDTSVWSPPSPDPSGITYWSAEDSLLVVDSEIDEMPPYFVGKNLFQSGLEGSLTNTYSILDLTNEPTGITVNPENGHIFISDDEKELIMEIDIGKDKKIGTSDDVVTDIDTLPMGSGDPEGVTFGDGELFFIDGVTATVYRINPGPDGLFNGIAPAGDDNVVSFNTSSFAIYDLQGIGFNHLHHSLFVVGRNSDFIVETTKSGNVIRLINIASLGIHANSGLTLGRSSNDIFGLWSIYIGDRGVDNSADPLENDGKIYELTYDRLYLDHLYFPLIFR